MTDTELRAVLADRVAGVRARITDACRRAGRDPAGVTLVAVTKSVTPRVAAVAAELGCRDLGEGRPQELWKKAEAVPGVNWHLVGHLQRNKIDRTVPLAALVHSVDSERVLDALDAFGRKRGVPVPVLLEVNCSGEGSKGGFAPDAVPAACDRAGTLAGVTVRGLMTMAAYADDPQATRPTFVTLRELRDSMRTRSGLPLADLSMGMSNDFEVAVEEGATLVRVGTTLFEGLEPASGAA
ncbi:YggS family pyridoxal phosphate-dependent enzyme [Frigoriglobus tundricola]|uniref:Pyridoxal phosphate homeostasis protein n=1 Tax=Frigoriglobus tundricola TaxID=2774151 RepID=A0A6M5YPJ4_9BACT|nr:YggS family pyridoxal phosphate-dependent enzyme [Frigoriglobus tundricola]QJW95330.1 Pyridoxal phosphate-containing protein YggS [Frigoriglobus tundricola]